MKQIKGFVPILLVLVGLAAIYFFTYPQWTKRSDAKAALAAAESQNATLKQAQADLNTFLAEYKSSSAQVQEADKILPNKKTDIENVLSNLDTFSANSGVALSGVTFTDAGLDSAGASKLSNYQVSYLEISLAATGTYASFRAFLTQFENSLRIMDILSVTLSTAQGQDNLEYKLRVRAYYQK